MKLQVLKLDNGLSVLQPSVLMIRCDSSWSMRLLKHRKMARDLRTMSIAGGNIICKVGYGRVMLMTLYSLSKLTMKKLYSLNMWRFDENKALKTAIYSEEVDYVGDNVWTMNDVEGSCRSMN